MLSSFSVEFVLLDRIIPYSAFSLFIAFLICLYLFCPFPLQSVWELRNF